jgi:hypothetical protein
MDLLQYIGSIGGIAGVMAFLMFLVYRQDRKTSEGNLAQIINQMQLKQAESETWQTEIVRAYNDTCRQHTEALVENTRMQSELMVWLKARNGH